jgi:Family of unknown function (DUF5996)
MSAKPSMTFLEEPWPSLALAEWKDTYATLHMYTQVVGKVRLALAPRVNHWWNVVFYVDATGLTTSSMPYPGGVLEIRFDFIEHRLVFQTSRGSTQILMLEPRTVADFYRDVRAALNSLSVPVSIWPMPVEIPDPIRFDEDRRHASYDARQAQRFWRVLVLVDTIFQEFRASFVGKSSPVHFFWGSFDHCVTRFSGRRAPEREGADAMTREAYSHEVISAGFWPGGGAVDGPAFYAYAAPEPPGFSQARILPAAAYYHPELKEFLLPYEEVRKLSSPKEAVLDFLQSTYEAGANLGKWDRAALERPGAP